MIGKSVLRLSLKPDLKPGLKPVRSRRHFVVDVFLEFLLPLQHEVLHRRPFKRRQLLVFLERQHANYKTFIR